MCAVSVREASLDGRLQPQMFRFYLQTVSDTQLFIVAGIEFTCALYVRFDDENDSKACIGFFSCSSTSAIHFEVILHISPDIFIQAFQTFHWK
jgi:hypothetical protein